VHFSHHSLRGWCEKSVIRPSSSTPRLLLADSLDSGGHTIIGHVRFCIPEQQFDLIQVNPGLHQPRRKYVPEIVEFEVPDVGFFLAT
jgi:hypothetical protein